MQILGIIFLIFIIFTSINSCDPKNEEEEKKKIIKKAEDRQKGLHCLSAWDGSSDKLVEYVKKRMRDSDSFKHRETRIGPNINDTHFIHMSYSGKNGFGGVSVEGISGKLSSNCDLIQINK